MSVFFFKEKAYKCIFIVFNSLLPIHALSSWPEVSVGQCRHPLTTWTVWCPFPRVGVSLQLAQVGHGMHVPVRLPPTAACLLQCTTTECNTLQHTSTHHHHGLKLRGNHLQEVSSQQLSIRLNRWLLPQASEGVKMLKSDACGNNREVIIHTHRLGVSMLCCNKVHGGLAVS